MHAPIVLLVDDDAVRSSLEFSLVVEGFDNVDRAAAGDTPAAAAALVIDQGSLAAGLAALEALRADGCSAPAIVLATNPTRRMRAQAAAAGAVVIEKPLLGDELTGALRAIQHSREAA